MPNQDYPGACLSCGTEDCKIIPADIATVRERIHEMVPEDGFTKFIVNNLKTAMSDKFADDAEAYLALDVVKAAIINGLKNKNVVDIKGLGAFNVHDKNVVFTPEAVLVGTVTE
jgi:hypothetical protein